MMPGAAAHIAHMRNRPWRQSTEVVKCSSKCMKWLYMSLSFTTPLVLGSQTALQIAGKHWPNLSVQLKVKLFHYSHRAQPSCADCSLSGQQSVTLSAMGPPCWWGGELHRNVLPWGRNCARDDNGHKRPDSQQPESRGELLSAGFCTTEEWKKKRASCNICTHKWVKENHKCIKTHFQNGYNVIYYCHCKTLLKKM